MSIQIYSRGTATNQQNTYKQKEDAISLSSQLQKPQKISSSSSWSGTVDMEVAITVIAERNGFFVANQRLEPTNGLAWKTLRHGIFADFAKDFLWMV